VINRDTVGSEATSPKTSGCARTTARSARQSPASAIATARSKTTLPGSWRARAARHGASRAPNARSRPLTAAVCASSEPPAEEINDSLPATTSTRRERRLLFTHGVPLSSGILRLRQAAESQAEQALPCIYAPCRPPRSAAERKIEASGTSPFPAHLGRALETTRAPSAPSHRPAASTSSLTLPQAPAQTVQGSPTRSRICVLGTPLSCGDWTVLAALSGISSTPSRTCRAVASTSKASRNSWTPVPVGGSWSSMSSERSLSSSRTTSGSGHSQALRQPGPAAGWAADLVQRGVSSLTVRGVTMWHAGDASGAA
jgi:hypothetical protein